MAIDELVGMRTTGRRVSGPAADLVEVLSPEARKQTALVFHERYRAHEALRSIDRLLPFLTSPQVEGVCPVLRHVAAEGVFVYDTGTSWSVAEIVRVFADMGEQAGIRAGVELCYLGGQVLVDAFDAAGARGLYAHGSLDPRRILVGADGRVSLLGYGLPPVDMLEHLETLRRPREEDTVRYAPPERFESMDEDLVSDLFCLALIGLELTMGRPVYDGLVDDIRQQASRGDAVRRLYQWRERLPDPVREAYGRALSPDPDARYRDGVDFVYAFHDLLGSLDAEGPGLGEVMTEFRAAIRRGKAFRGGDTGALTTEELAALAADLESEAQRTLPPPRRPRPPEEPDEPEEVDPGEQRWRRVSRAAREEEEPSARDRLRDRIKGKEEGSARDRLKARLRNRNSGSGARGRPRRLGRGRDDGEDDEGNDTPDDPAADPRTEAPPSTGTTDQPAAAAVTPAVAPAVTPAVIPAARPPVAPAVAPPPVVPAPAASEAVQAAPGGAAAALLEKLRSTPAPAPARTTPVSLSVDLAGTLETIALEPTTSAAEAAARIADRFEPIAVDLLGNIVAWPVLEQGGRRVASELMVADLASGGPVRLAWIPSRTVRLPIEVRVEPPIRFEAPISTAIPARHLVAHLRRWLDLPAGPWSLRIGGRNIEPHQILADLEPLEGASLTVSR